MGGVTKPGDFPCRSNPGCDMPEATDQQMQAFADTRIRPFAERLELLIINAREHKAAIDDEYARAVGTSRWNDARTDGPPHLLQSGNSANPDDFTNFNSLITALLTVVDGTDPGADAANAAAIRSALPVLNRAVVRTLGQ